MISLSVGGVKLPASEVSRFVEVLIRAMVPAFHIHGNVILLVQPDDLDRACEIINKYPGVAIASHFTSEAMSNDDNDDKFFVAVDRELRRNYNVYATKMAGNSVGTIHSCTDERVLGHFSWRGVEVLATPEEQAEHIAAKASVS